MHDVYSRHVGFVILAVLWLFTCHSEDRIEESPLATWDTSSSDAFAMSASGEGTLEISEDCVLLVHNNNQSTTLLVWPEPTSWNSESQAIEFVGVEGERLELHEGDRLIAGGAATTGLTPYVVPPDPSCEADEIFVLHGIKLLTSKPTTPVETGNDTVESSGTSAFVPPTEAPAEDTAVSSGPTPAAPQSQVVETEPPALTTWETQDGESPLATWQPGEGELLPDAGSGQGALEISDDCTRLILSNQTAILLVWPEPTSWNSASQTIEFVGAEGERLELRDGDQIYAGGYTPIVEGSIQFTIPPQPSCEADELFIVNSIEVVTD